MAAKRSTRKPSKKPANKSTKKPAKKRKPKAAKRVALRLDAFAKDTVLYDLVCDVDGELASGLGFAVCNDKARAHNKKNPGHDAAPIRQQ